MEGHAKARDVGDIGTGAHEPCKIASQPYGGAHVRQYVREAGSFMWFDKSQVYATNLESNKK